MSHYKPYPAYKDSGVEWLGRVPEHWVTKKLLYWISGYGSGTTPSSEDEYSTDGLPWVTTGELRENTVSSTEKCVTHDALKNNSALKLHPAGSLVIAMYGATVGRLGVLGIDATLNQACFAIHPGERVQIPFLRNWFEGFRTELVSLATGAGQPNISGDKIRNLLLPCPQDLSEQAAIIAHLDRETARIDALIEKKIRFIELLREKRQALITRAVTKGIDPNVKIKDSGVEWLGEVPEHWEVRPLKYLASHIGSGKTPSGGAEVYRDSGVLFLRSQNVYEDGLRLDDAAFISDEVDEEMKGSRVMPGDVLLNITGASIGRSCKVPVIFERANVNQHVCIIRGVQQLVSKWISLCLPSMAAQAQIDFFQNGAGREGLNFQQIGNMLIALPYAEEVDEIANRLDRETARIDMLKVKTERSIELLKERRSALITAAVTGQIDLREAV